ncbi:MAG: hypothetical protein QW279_13930 [Candidatus Jordarchaeaceae archaeon]
MKALIASIVSLIILLFTIIEIVDYFSLNIKLLQDVQPAFKGDYTNATENITETITDYRLHNKLHIFYGYHGNTWAIY